MLTALGGAVRVELTAGSFEPGNRAGAQLVAATARAVAAATRLSVLVTGLPERRCPWGATHQPRRQ